MKLDVYQELESTNAFCAEKPLRARRTAILYLRRVKLRAGGERDALLFSAGNGRIYEPVA